MAMSMLSWGAYAGFQGIPNAGPGGDPPLSPDGVWQGPFDEFLPSPGGFFNETWTATVAETVRITDLYVPGDNYEVYVNNNLVATTSVGGGGAYDSNPASAWTESQFAHVLLDVNAGDMITIYDTPPAPYGDGTYSISAIPVPEVTTAGAGALLLLPFAAAAVRMLRRNSAV